MNQPFISIIIVSWNALHHLKRFLPSVSKTDYSKYEIILADNASTDESVNWVKKNYPSIIIHQMDKNYGYCGGNNKAVESAKGEILLFLNNDVAVHPNWLKGIADVFSNPKIGIAQPKMLSLNQPEYFEYAGAAGGFIDYLGYPFCRGRIFDSLEKDLGQYDKESEIFWASGAAFAIRKSLFLQLNGFDESFEFHMEEIDVCWRANRLGYSAVYVPNSTVWHLGGGSLNAQSPRKTFYNFRNNWWMLQKNLSPEVYASIFLKRFMFDSLALIKELLSFRFNHAKAIFDGVSQALSNPKNYIPLDGKQIIKPHQKSIILEYFVFKKKRFSDL